jgi:hypothetical protein
VFEALLKVKFELLVFSIRAKEYISTA